MSRGLHAVADEINERKAEAADREWLIREPVLSFEL
jgi:hypothetical protein